MRYISLYKPAEFKEPSQELIAAMGKLIEESMKAGVLISTGGFHPSPKDVRVRRENGAFRVTDGPFTESKELVGGYAILECRSREHAIEEAKRFLSLAGGGECEIHELC